MVAMALHERECNRCKTLFLSNRMADIIVSHSMFYFCPACVKKFKELVKDFITTEK